MKNFLSILALVFLLNGCGKNVPGYDESNSSLLTSSFETATGGKISNHIFFGENSYKLLERAKKRCKKISSKSKVKNLRQTYLGNVITNQMNMYEYDCIED